MVQESSGHYLAVNSFLSQDIHIVDGQKTLNNMSLISLLTYIDGIFCFNERLFMEGSKHECLVLDSSPIGFSACSQAGCGPLGGGWGPLTLFFHSQIHTWSSFRPNLFHLLPALTDWLIKLLLTSLW